MKPFPDGALLLAPMVGITDRAFRSLVAELSPPDYAFTEMAGVEGFITGSAEDAIYTDPRPDPARTSVQFYAKQPERLALACGKLAGLPEEIRPAGVDINFGCAAPRIRKAGGGAAWSADPDGAVRLVEAARAAWPGWLSAKLRSGPDEDPDRLLDHCRRLESAGLDFLTLHPRTDSQKFRRAANHRLTGLLAAELRIPVVANGDLRERSHADRLHSEQAPAALMIGREAARRPWIFAILRGSEPCGTANPGMVADGRIDRIAVAFRYLDLVDADLPEAWKAEHARRVMAYYAEGFSFAHHLKWNLVNAPGIVAMRAVLREYLAEVPQDRWADLR